MYKTVVVLCLIICLLACPVVAQDKPTFASFLKKFSQKNLPYVCVVNPKANFRKNTQISKEEAANFLTDFPNTDGRNINIYESLIEPFPPTKNEAGIIFSAKTTAQKIALLKRTPTYVLVLIRVAFENQGLDNMAGEQYVLHSFTTDGKPLTSVPIAQHVQFDLHSNKVSGRIDAAGNIKTLVEIFTVSNPRQYEEKYKILESGKIVAVK